MLPVSYKYVDLMPPKLEHPFEAEFTFVGGPFDGHKSTATVKRELSERVTVVMKKTEGEITTRYKYTYAGNNTFQYEGLYVSETLEPEDD